MKAQLARVGARGIDADTIIDAIHARDLKAAGIDYVHQYLGSVSQIGVEDIVAAGLAFMPVTYADQWDGQKSVRELVALGIPAGTTVWLDVEGPAIMPDRIPVATLIANIDGWAREVAASGFQPGAYIGSPQPLTGEELYALSVVRYWKAPANVVDRNGVLTQPHCGFCEYQLYDSQMVAGVWSDYDFIQRDLFKRLPSWCVA